jgi:hypothetical protein
VANASDSRSIFPVDKVIGSGNCRMERKWREAAKKWFQDDAHKHASISQVARKGFRAGYGNRCQALDHIRGLA